MVFEYQVDQEDVMDVLSKFVCRAEGHKWTMAVTGDNFLFTHDHYPGVHLQINDRNLDGQVCKVLTHLQGRRNLKE